MRAGPPEAPDPGRFALITEATRLVDEVAAAVEAEEHGFERVLVGESPWGADAFLRSARILEATQRIAVGPGIVDTSLRHPLVLARAAATLDRLARGRAHLGVGRGDPAALEAATGLPAALASAGLEDALRICGPLLRGEAADWTGRRWSARTGPLSGGAAPSSRVPLLCAAVGERALRLAGALADAVVLNYGAPPEYVEWAVARVAEGADGARRAPEAVDVLGVVLVARTDVPGAERTVEEVRRTLRFVLSIPDQGRALAAQAGGVPADVDDDTLRRFAAVGDGAAVGARLEAYRAAGLRCVVVMP
ncbi:MAG TPA: LLM class flavin-dependent oxidoreductase, partial [Candidatus Dormibacteraeota bacterium]|nr:LLM class flavin-dependent oxidoreductase [Candidatus Dormibacteraeota bacterium]